MKRKRGEEVNRRREEENRRRGEEEKRRRGEEKKRERERKREGGRNVVFDSRHQCSESSTTRKAQQKHPHR